MSRGYLMFAHNNEEIEYLTIALCNALMIRNNSVVKRVSVVTDAASMFWLTEQFGSLPEEVFDQIIIVDSPKGQPRQFRDTRSTSKMLPWKNTTRSSAYSMSPYDETLLIDCDFLILDRSLDAVWGSNEDLMINSTAMTLEYASTHPEEQRLGVMTIPMRWATCVYFKRGKDAQILFDTVDHVRENYLHYQALYQFPGEVFRNDYAFSIAIHIMNGWRDEGVKSLPNPVILTSFDCDELHDVPEKNVLHFLVNDSDRHYAFHLGKVTTNVHVMNKFAIVRLANKIVELYR